MLITAFFLGFTFPSDAASDAAVVVALSTTTIYQCSDPVTGHRSFSDLGCAPQQSMSNVDLSPTLVIAPLSSAEKIRLNKLQATLSQQQKTRHKQRLRQSQKRDKLAEIDRKECTNAKAKLSQLRQQRRQGYSLKQYKKLRQHERQYEKAKRQSC